LTTAKIFAALASLLALAGAALWLLPREEAPSAQPFNVVVIMADTLRADHLGGWGYHRATSPNIDHFFQAGGVVFYGSRAQASCTYPSANSILTSRYPAVFLDQPEKRMGIPSDVPTLAGILKQRGYSTIAVSASPIVRNTGTKYNNHGGFGAGFDAFDEHCLWREARCVLGRLVPLLDEAQEPFFLYLHYMDIHDPYRPPGWYRKRFAVDGDQRIDFARVGNPNPIADAMQWNKPMPEYAPEDLQHLVDLYDDEIAYFDGEFGVLMGDLAQRGFLDRTIVVLVSDHGEQFLEHGFMKHCYTLFDTDILTPLAMRIPGVPGGIAIADPVENVDLVPTVLDYLEIDPGEFSFDGHSLRRFIEGGGEKRSDPGYAFAMQGPRRSVTDERFKLLFDARKREFGLHDLATDPEERVNVIEDHPEDFLRLQHALHLWEADIAGGRTAEELVRAGEEVQERLRALGYLR
jgi:arylsulfatase A-like enzyme